MRTFLFITYALAAYVAFRWSEPSDYPGLPLFFGWWLAGILYYLNAKSASAWMESKIQKMIESRNLDGYLKISEELKKMAGWLLFISVAFVVLKTYATEGYCASYLSSNPTWSQLNTLTVLLCFLEPLVPRGAIEAIRPFRESFFVGMVASLAWCVAIGLNWLVANCVSGMSEWSRAKGPTIPISFLVGISFMLLPGLSALAYLSFSR